MKLKIYQKLVLAFLILATAVLVMGYLRGYWIFLASGRNLKRVSDLNYVYSLSEHLRLLIALNLITPLNNYISTADLAYKSEFEKALVEVSSHFKELYARKELGEEERNTLQDVKKSIDEIIVKKSREIFNLENPIGNPSAMEWMRQIDAEAHRILDLLEDNIDDFIKAEIAKVIKRVGNFKTLVSWVFVLTTAISLFLSYLFGTRIANSISMSLKKLRDLTGEISAGNLKTLVDIKTGDELEDLGSAFNKMVQDLEQDITARKKVEKEREALINELKERQELLERQKQELGDSRRAIKNVAEDLARSKQLLEERKGSLEKINKELDDFTYIVSHDLKEPLRSIDAFSKFLDDDYKDKIDEEGKGYIKRIRANSLRMQNLIEDLLEISRIERRRSPFEEVEASVLINEVKLRLEYTIKEKNVEIVIQDALPKIFCDRVRLVEVFANLFSNAIKFNDKPNPRIEVGCTQKDDYYEFYVKDKGPGIEEQYFDKIFEIFQRLGKKEDHEGTGAGLTIVKKIVEMHKGKIWVESKVSEYTTFYFTIPKKKQVILGKKKIGEILVEKGLLSDEELKKALDEQERIN